MRGKKRDYLAVWRRGGEEASCRLPLPDYAGRKLRIRCAYPADRPVDFSWDAQKAELTVAFPEAFMARLFEIENLS